MTELTKHSVIKRNQSNSRVYSKKCYINWRHTLKNVSNVFHNFFIRLRFDNHSYIPWKHF